MKIDESYVARRRFLGCVLGGGAAALGAGVAGPLAGYVGNLREDPPPDFIELAKEDYDLSPGKGKLILYGRIPVLLLRPPAPDDDLRVFLATCTHFDCTVGYKEQENRIYCACHEGYYDVDGNVVSGPPPRPLPQIPHALAGDKLILALEKENLEKVLAQHD